jgi:hypothetical protein
MPDDAPRIMPPYRTRFIRKAEAGELLGLWRTAGIPCRDAHERKCLAVKWFVEKYPMYTSTAVYKDLCGLLEGPV